ncbi:hypothetical protein N0V90_006489 [Kalmusia sp. IMI 367209]|nr:hypothetical protein N0V90_006489 [Kalmusia sp. IMI 367209]
MPTFQALKEALQELLVHFDTLYIVVDAVDESSPRGNLLEFLQEIILKPEYGKIQLLITSRRYADIEGALRFLSEPSLPMSNSIVDADIRTYIESSMGRNKKFMAWSANFRNEITTSLAQGAQGMLQRKSVQQAREAIKHLPKTIEETYELILLEIPQEDWITVRTALQWIIAHSSLGLPTAIPMSYLSSAISSHDSTSVLDVDEDAHKHEYLKDILGCLIEVNLIDPIDFTVEWGFLNGDSLNEGGQNDQAVPTILLAHYTIQEFLFSERMKMSKISYFAMSEETCAQLVLETVLRPEVMHLEYIALA